MFGAPEPDELRQSFRAWAKISGLFICLWTPLSVVCDRQVNRSMNEPGRRASLCLSRNAEPLYFGQRLA
jgi:hypothetical protein